MPRHFACISRRAFLVGAAALPALLRPLRAAGAAPKVDANRMILFADPHIDADAGKVARGVNLVEHLAQSVREALAVEPRPTGALVVGDCAFNRGLRGDYEQLKKAVQPFANAKLPLHLLLGNHDRRETFFGVMKPGLDVPGKHVAILEAPRANWFLLDSLDKPNQVAGRLGDEQRAWLTEALDQRARKPAIIVAHHNLDPTGQQRGKTSGLLDSQELLDLLLPRKHVKAYVHGHSHAWAQSAAEGLHIVGLPAVAYTFDKAQPSGWILADLREQGITLELRCLDPTHKLHGQKLDLAWRP